MLKISLFEKAVLITPFLTILPLALLINDQTFACWMVACALFIAAIPLKHGNLISGSKHKGD